MGKYAIDSNVESLWCKNVVTERFCNYIPKYLYVFACRSTMSRKKNRGTEIFRTKLNQCIVHPHALVIFILYIAIKR